MPLIQVFTSAPAPASDRGTTLLGELSGIAAARFGKPERWVMTALVPGDWVPTLVDIAGGPKGDGLKKEIENGAYKGIVQTPLDGVDQRAYCEGTSDTAAQERQSRQRRVFPRHPEQCLPLFLLRNSN